MEKAVDPIQNITTVVCGPTSSRRTVYRDSESAKNKNFVKISLPLFGHFALCLAVTLLVALKLNGYKALAYEWQTRSQPDGHYVFRVSDVTSLLSAATTLINIIGSMWTSIVSWRCALILLETGGLKINHLSQIIGGFPPWKRPRGKEWLVGLVLIFILPQAIIEPIFSGSVNWNFSLDYAREIRVSSRDPTANSVLWYWYLTQNIDRKHTIRQAAGMASTAWSATDSQQSKDGTLMTPGGITCRRVMPGIFPVNSTLIGATIPCIQIHNITWPDGPVPDDIWQYGGLNKGEDLSSIGETPFGYVQSGVAVLFSRKEPKWNTAGEVAMDRNTGTAAFPQATKWSGNMTFLVLLGRQKQNDCKPIAGNAFGNSSYITQQVPEVFTANGNAVDVNCMAWGTVYFTAGVIQAPKSTFVSSRVVEYNPLATRADGTLPSFSEAEISAAIEPSIWTREALWLMPDAMTQMAVMNTSLLPTWQNLENYTATLIRSTYMANWDMLHAAFDDKDTALLTLYPAEGRLQASVTLARLFAWFALTLLVPLTGIILNYMHRYCSRGMITDPVAVLFTDSSGVTNKYPDLTGMVAATKEDEKMGHISLEQVEQGKPQFRLKVE